MKPLLPLAVFGLTSLTSYAVVNTALDNEVAPPGSFNFTPSYVVSNNDLLQTSVGSIDFLGDFAATELTGGVPVLTDGIYGTITEPGGASDRTHFIFGIAGRRGWHWDSAYLQFQPRNERPRL